ncbi:MAG: winged helix-turn-helix domain-containing protein [Pyrinomonadaceae bacterium MAG19_C2-C3]|nr:winged helix-turn-helix domain-containing protein [Pyrinomonadaceae bacterium MAG19_C2-C3]
MNVTDAEAERLPERVTVMLARQGRIIRKEEFFEKVWRGTCVEDNNLTVAVAQLRKTLGETNDSKFIETVPRKGYRFVLPVEMVFDKDAKREREQSETTVEEPATVFELSETLDEQPTRVIEKSDAGVFARLASRKVLVFAVLALILFSVAALWQRSASVRQAEPLRAVAVLPFSDNTTSGDNGLYAEELTQDLTYNLGRISDIRVSAYDAVMTFDASDFDPDGDSAKIKDTLKIDAAVIGKIQHDKDKINFAIELKDSRRGVSRWEKRYSFDKQDLPPTPHRIARDIALQLGNHEPFGNTPAITATTNYEAYRAYLVARHYSVKRSLRDNVCKFL